MQQLNKIKTVKIFLVVFLLFAAGIINAQIGIGIANPTASAQLDVSSTTRGFLPPRMTQEERNAISNPVAGLMIWCKNCGQSGEIQVYNGTTWTNMVGGQAASIPAVTIGTQAWTQKNLDVTRYRNGDIIPEVTDSAQWASLTTGAWCYYNNDPAIGEVYGKLYNYYAVTDPRGLAPAGWHIANNITDAFFQPVVGDWLTLVNNLGGGSPGELGIKMKAETLWNNPGTNSSGFTGLPGGYRTKDGRFSDISNSANWWGSSTFDEYAPHDYYGNSFHPAWKLNQGFSNEFIPVYVITTTNQDGEVTPHYEPTYNERMGFSVRCVKDASSPVPVNIGTQVWMSKNLEETAYRNGDPIPEVSDTTKWDTLTTGAWCYIHNNADTGAVYGKLYNWYAVHDLRGLAPAGWRVATDSDWDILVTFLGGEALAGNKIKETGNAHWRQANTGASNSSGFTALPGGKIHSGTFKQFGFTGTWWTGSSSSTNANTAWYRETNYYNGNVARWAISKKTGFAVRCVKE